MTRRGSALLVASVALAAGIAPSPACAGEPARASEPAAGDLSSGQRAGLFLKALETARSARTKEELRQAIDLYESLAASFPPGTRNGYLEYNWGNAFFRYEDLGRAILHWRRAEELLPGDPQVAHNLMYARSRVPDRFEERSAGEVARLVFFWHALPFSTRYWLALAAFACFWAIVTARLFLRRWFLTAAAIAALAVALPMGLSAGVSYHRERSEPPAVIVAAEAIVRQGDGDTYEPLFKEPVHSGTEVRMVEERGGWVRIAFPDGKDGWVRGDTVERV